MSITDKCGLIMRRIKSLFFRRIDWRWSVKQKSSDRQASCWRALRRTGTEARTSEKFVHLSISEWWPPLQLCSVYVQQSGQMKRFRIQYTITNIFSLVQPWWVFTVQRSSSSRPRPQEVGGATAGEGGGKRVGEQQCFIDARERCTKGVNSILFWSNRGVWEI